ncbi:PD40 domain-containing protein, partial [Escherichia coli]|uniref:PD40 domain-containing protein n=1 Tax=Escherichia coli TaxID=562 RepID=UPI00116FDB7F
QTVVQLLALMNKPAEVPQPLTTLLRVAPELQRPGLIVALPRLFQRSPDPKAVLAALGPVLQAQTGLGPKERFLLPKTGYYTLLDWSPDGRWLAVADNHLNLYRLGLAAGPQRGQLVKVDTSLRRGGGFGSAAVSFSPDSRWLAYTST